MPVRDSTLSLSLSPSVFLSLSAGPCQEKALVMKPKTARDRGGPSSWKSRRDAGESQQAVSSLFLPAPSLPRSRLHLHPPFVLLPLQHVRAYPFRPFSWNAAPVSVRLSCIARSFLPCALRRPLPSRFSFLALRRDFPLLFFLALPPCDATLPRRGRFFRF